MGSPGKHINPSRCVRYLVGAALFAGACVAGELGSTSAAAGEPVQTAAADRDFRAFRPPVRPQVPVVNAGDRVRTPVDAFLLKALEEKGAGFNPDAPRRVLIRRLYFDLWGLPPTPDDVRDFLNDDRPDAYERLVDRLLASPRYGERWGRHWLDVAGYADSDGYLEADRLRPEAWRYRDYVIRAFNEDKPFDRFVLEQVAGDELADWRRAPEMTPELADNLVATGFLRTAMDPTYGNYAEPLECHKVMADTIQIVGSAFLGLTIQCARCHDHKLEPVSQQDYYRLNAIFLASYDPERWQVSAARTIPLATEAEQARIEKHNQAVDARLKTLNAELAALNGRYRDKLLGEALASVTDASLREQVKAALLVEPAKRTAGQKQLIERHAPKVSLAEKDLAAKYPDYRRELEPLRAAIAAQTASKQEIVQLRGLRDLEGTPAQARVLLRGDFNTPGQSVEPGLPAVLVSDDERFKPEPGDKTTGRRKELAEWLVDPQNPLTARVHVNRVWAHHFGRGIVATLDNFGKSGTRPSHPELLDWLAQEFIENGWSRKALHRLILTSTAYRQTSDPNPQLAAADPENILLGSWRPRRHAGEVLRDSVLAAAGKLDLQMYGTPVPVARHSDGRVTVADSPAGNRRSVYLIVRRSQPVTLLELFDTPKMEVNCPERTESVVVTQSLALINSGFVEAGAKSLAENLCSKAPADEEQRIDLAYEVLFARRPTDSERQAVHKFLDDVVRAELRDKFETASAGERQAAHRSAWTQLALVLLNSNEFLFVH